MVVVVSLVAVACAPSSKPQKEVVLWEAGRVEPRFPAPPEASWEPRYQHLFQDHQDLLGGEVRWVCYSTAGPEQALAFYAEVFSAPAVWQPEHPDTWLALAQRISEAEDLAAPPVPPAEPRWTRWEQRDDLPSVTLHTPYLEVTSGELRHGALIVLRWSGQGER